MAEGKKVVIFGTSSFAEVAYYYLTKDSPYEVVAFTVDRNFITKKEKFGLPVVSFEEVEKIYPPEEFKMFIAVGFGRVNRLRAEKYYQAKEKGYELISYVCSKAIVWDNVKIGDNCFIFEANVVQPFVKIGNNVIIWSGNHIGHHTVIGDHVFIASHAVISGHCKIGAYSFIGVNSTLRDGISIAEDCIIGASALIVKDTQKGGVYGGQPAKLLRTVYEKELAVQE
ncbi:sugar O-acyltransferase, sialic acid O-acetyltransferase NeuD family [Geoglobus ahangari]|uniref:Sugar O-acyltransferase, sialic acid O-acetyltransferase NeuD family n=1 Tax=Geoglobus ahangari TaxID=113653 RepID=A0A0F7IE74_9EURY|nr:acetyltransferase [Geoglobus ahangari]AKG91247.1 sugar O-acyltransferase, sialic acid O-acetyltransferase NeuD family [Geoglobus ahangari]